MAGDKIWLLQTGSLPSNKPTGVSRGRLKGPHIWRGLKRRLVVASVFPANCPMSSNIMGQPSVFLSELSHVGSDGVEKSCK